MHNTMTAIQKAFKFMDCTFKTKTLPEENPFKLDTYSTNINEN